MMMQTNMDHIICFNHHRPVIAVMVAYQVQRTGMTVEMGGGEEPPLSVWSGGNQGTDLDALERRNDSRDGDDQILYGRVGEG